VYFWRIDRLKSELRARELPARDAFGYATAHLLCWTLPNFLPLGKASITATDDALMVVATFIIVGGLWVAYRANGGVDGRDFAGRLLAMGWVLGVRLTVLWIVCAPLLLIIAFAAGVLKERPSDSAIRGIGWIFLFVTSLVFYWRLTHHLRDVRRAV
jgi:hypothetical protein